MTVVGMSSCYNGEKVNVAWPSNLLVGVVRAQQSGNEEKFLVSFVLLRWVPL